MAIDPSGTLHVDLEVGLHWQAVPAPVPGADDSADAEVSRALVVMLRALDALVEPDGGDAGRQQALARIEAKLDLLLLMFGRGATAGVSPGAASAPVAAAPVRVRLSPETLTWTPAGTVPAPGTRIEIALRLDPSAPFALRLPARVVSVDPAAAAAGTLSARFTGLTDEARDALAARVFRLHRRAIQLQRAPG